jgi:hypothetical protein
MPHLEFISAAVRASGIEADGAGQMAPQDTVPGAADPGLVAERNFLHKCSSRSPAAPVARDSPQPIKDFVSA